MNINFKNLRSVFSHIKNFFKFIISLTADPKSRHIHKFERDVIIKLKFQYLKSIKSAKLK